MSDDAARRDTPDAEPVEEHAHAAPPPAAAAAAPPPAAAAPAAAPPPVTSPTATPPPVTPPPPAAAAPAGRWGPDLRVRRGPVIAGAALLLGCVLGAGVTAVGAAVAGSFRHGDGHSVRHDRGGYDRPDVGRKDRGGRPGHHHQRPGPGATPPAPTPPAASPSAS
jgi:hypothetical protein